MEGRDLSNLKASDISVEPASTVSMDADLDQVMEAFRKTGSGRIIMTDHDGKPAGILKRKNLERFSAYMGASKKEMG
jgi:predicted transcriptional regulator